MSADRPIDGSPQAASPGALDRRAFLERASGVLTGVLAAGSPFALVAPSRVWALDLKTLGSAEGTTLMAAARTIAPHDHLEDAAYALVVGALDTAAAHDDGLRKQLKDGVAQLGASFAGSPESRRVAALKAFQTVRTYTLRVLYATPPSYTAFGYEGEAFSKGGYLLRGFNELRWLPEVPLADSGSV
jgi:hypothetical protein